MTEAADRTRALPAPPSEEILVDAKSLLYATVSDFPQHGRTRTWLEEVL